LFRDLEKIMSNPSKKHLVIFQPSGRRGEVVEGRILLDAARDLGVEIESICGGQQTCGKCKILVEEGQFSKYGIRSACEHLSPEGEAERSYWARRKPGAQYRLSCAARVQGPLVINVPEESQARKQIVRKSATERVIELDPAIRQYYVKVTPSVLGDERGDWQLLQAALEEQFGLTELQIDLPALQSLQDTQRAGKWGVTVSVWDGREVVRVQPGYAEGAYGLAVDIGTTTVVAHLCDLRTGAVVGTEAMMNPQVPFGEDILSRVSYIQMQEDGLSRLNTAIIDGLNKLARRVARRAGLAPDDITDAVLVGNTVMHHIVLNISPVYIGGSPFTLATYEAVDVKARDLGLTAINRCAQVHVLPCEAGYVGADNVGVLLAEEPHRQDEIVLVIDIGTNGEILLGNREHLLSASSPTGPAFEGAQIAHGMRAAPGAIERVRIDPETLKPRFRVIGDERWSDELPTEEIQAAGICGSGIIEVVAELFARGILLPTGKFNIETPSPNFRATEQVGEFILATAEQTSTGHEIVITQSDVRAVQLAKGALYAGAKLLMARRGVDRLDRVILAGAFGSYISKEHALLIGLFPDCDLAHVYAVGNAAGDGARIALLSRAKRREASQAARWIDYVETAVEMEFQKEFVAALNFPHASDSFPHLDGLLPAQAVAAAAGERPSRQRRARIRSQRSS
jgi:uncharacterized 2Fe-2S/4Fe-4S cluster protein (DUF4445 family)